MVVRLCVTRMLAAERPPAAASGPSRTPSTAVTPGGASTPAGSLASGTPGTLSADSPFAQNQVRPSDNLFAHLGALACMTINCARTGLGLSSQQNAHMHDRTGPKRRVHEELPRAVSELDAWAVVIVTWRFQKKKIVR